MRGIEPAPADATQESTLLPIQWDDAAAAGAVGQLKPGQQEKAAEARAV